MNYRLGDLGQIIAKIAPEMVSESVQDGAPYGLRGWAEWYHKSSKLKFDPVRDWESVITRCIVQRLWRLGFPAFAEAEYPHYAWESKNKQRCDLVVQIDNSEFVWVECKTAYFDSFRKTPGGLHEWDYSGESLVTRNEGCVPENAIKTANQDIHRLSQLKRPEASYVVMLMFIWDHPGNLLTHECLTSNLPIDSQWLPIHDEPLGYSWPDANPSRAERGFRDRCLFWAREVD